MQFYSLPHYKQHLRKSTSPPNPSQVSLGMSCQDICESSQSWEPGDLDCRMPRPGPNSHHRRLLATVRWSVRATTLLVPGKPRDRSYVLPQMDSCCDRLHELDRKSTRLNSSHQIISYAVFCLK